MRYKKTINFLGQDIVVGKSYVYLKNKRTGSSTIRKLKMIGICIDENKLLFQRLYCEPSSYYKLENQINDKVYDLEDVICEYQPTEEHKKAYSKELEVRKEIWSDINWEELHRS